MLIQNRVTRNHQPNIQTSGQDFAPKKSLFPSLNLFYIRPDALYVDRDTDIEAVAAVSESVSSTGHKNDL